MLNDSEQASLNSSKTCPKCHQEKNIDLFSRCANRKDGRQVYCKECAHGFYLSLAPEKIEKKLANYRKWAIENHEKRLIYHRDYYKSNQARKCEYRRIYYARYSDRLKAYARKWKRENSERHKMALRDWERLNPEKKRASRHIRRARIAGNGGRYTQAEVQFLINSQKGQCAYCKQSGQPLQLEHIKPVAQGGASNIENICLACAKCNHSKGNRTPDQWLNRWYLNE